MAAYLWYWDWISLGIPSPLRAEHFITILSYVLGVVVLGIFIYRLNRNQDTIMLVGMVVVNLLAVSGHNLDLPHLPGRFLSCSGINQLMCTIRFM